MDTRHPLPIYQFLVEQAAQVGKETFRHRRNLRIMVPVRHYGQ